MTHWDFRHVTVICRNHDGTRTDVDTMGLAVPEAPGLVITPWHEEATPVEGRFTLTHAESGRAVVPLAWCPHRAREWAAAAGQIGAPWHEDYLRVMDSAIAMAFAWRLFDEWPGAACGDCPVLPVDAKLDDNVDRYRMGGRMIEATP